MKKYFETIAVDFDHTIVKDEYPDILYTYPKAKKYINKLYKDYCIIIHTCRTGKTQKDAERWLKKEGIKFDYINSNNIHRVNKFGDDSRKVSADIYIDDRGILMLPMKNKITPDWKKIYKKVKKWKRFVPK